MCCWSRGRRWSLCGGTRDLGPTARLGPTAGLGPTVGVLARPGDPVLLAGYSFALSTSGCSVAFSTNG
jgi:hypothetical protein